MRDYDDIINKSRPYYPDHPPMSAHDRAAQFSPFAALVGYDEAVAETVRLTDKRREMSEEEISELNVMLNELKIRLSSRPLVTVHYFLEDGRKEGGSYRNRTGRVRTIDEYNNLIVFEGDAKIPVADTYKIVFEDQAR